MSMRIELVLAQDGSRLLVNVWAAHLRRGITIPLSDEVSRVLDLMQKEELAREQMATSPSPAH